MSGCSGWGVLVSVCVCLSAEQTLNPSRWRWQAAGGKEAAGESPDKTARLIPKLTLNCLWPAHGPSVVATPGAPGACSVIDFYDNSNKEFAQTIYPPPAAAPADANNVQAARCPKNDKTTSVQIIELRFTCSQRNSVTASKTLKIYRYMYIDYIK